MDAIFEKIVPELDLKHDDDIEDIRALLKMCDGYADLELKLKDISSENNLLEKCVFYSDYPISNDETDDSYKTLSEIIRKGLFDILFLCAQSSKKLKDDRRKSDPPDLRRKEGKTFLNEVGDENFKPCERTEERHGDILRERYTFSTKYNEEELEKDDIEIGGTIVNVGTGEDYECQSNAIPGNSEESERKKDKLCGTIVNVRTEDDIICELIDFFKRCEKNRIPIVIFDGHGSPGDGGKIVLQKGEYVTYMKNTDFICKVIEMFRTHCVNKHHDNALRIVLAQCHSYEIHENIGKIPIAGNNCVNAFSLTSFNEDYKVLFERIIANLNTSTIKDAEKCEISVLWVPTGNKGINKARSDRRMDLKKNAKIERASFFELASYEDIPSMKSLGFAKSDCVPIPVPILLIEGQGQFVKNRNDSSMKSGQLTFFREEVDGKMRAKTEKSIDNIIKEIINSEACSQVIKDSNFHIVFVCMTNTSGRIKIEPQKIKKENIWTTEVCNKGGINVVYLTSTLYPKTQSLLGSRVHVNLTMNKNFATGKRDKPDGDGGCDVADVPCAPDSENHNKPKILIFGDDNSEGLRRVLGDMKDCCVVICKGRPITHASKVLSENIATLDQGSSILLSFGANDIQRCLKKLNYCEISTRIEEVKNDISHLFDVAGTFGTKVHIGILQIPPQKDDNANYITKELNKYIREKSSSPSNVTFIDAHLDHHDIDVINGKWSNNGGRKKIASAIGDFVNK